MCSGYIEVNPSTNNGRCWKINVNVYVTCLKCPNQSTKASCARFGIDVPQRPVCVCVCVCVCVIDIIEMCAVVTDLLCSFSQCLTVASLP